MDWLNGDSAVANLDAVAVAHEPFYAVARRAGGGAMHLPRHMGVSFP
jgi:hypothetical protein